MVSRPSTSPAARRGRCRRGDRGDQQRDDRPGGDVEHQDFQHEDHARDRGFEDRREGGARADQHLLVGDADRLGNIRQLKILLDRGYQGVVSFEPFAAEVMDAKNSEEILKTSMDFIRANV
jgi:2-keto-myo-inositol isomerase